MLGTVGVLVASVVAGLLGVFLDYTQAFKKTLVGLCASCFVLSLIFPYILREGMQFDTLMAFTLVYLSVSVAMAPLGMTFSVELTYPVNAALVNGLVGLCGEILATIFSISGSFWIDVDYSKGMPTDEKIADQRHNVR